MGTTVPRRCAAVTIACLLGAALLTGVATAVPPDEVSGAAFVDPSTLVWSSAAGADSYNVYRGSLAALAAGVPAGCRGFEIAGTLFDVPTVPAAGEGFAFLVTGESGAGEEGTAGTDSLGAERPLLGSCESVMRTHVLDRLGYGWSEWSRDRLELLGREGYIAEQLDPASIDELTNDELNDRLIPIDPPVSIFELIQQQVIRGVYARRQLEQQMATFWANHFNTYWGKVAEIFQGVYPQCQTPGVPPQCDENFPAKAYEVASLLQYREIESFRSLSFEGNFREMVESSALSLAMIVYLDTHTSVVGAPNENFPRELMELHTMGVDGGYTQQDVEELSRVITGWTGCKKRSNYVGDPLGPCIQEYWEDLPPGEWTATFVPSYHDCTVKVLFQDTPQQVVIPNTCASPEDGVNDLYLALDAIVDHPATARFITTKILERLVTDEPDEELIDALVDVWNDPGNPHGLGDIRAVVEAALHPDVFLDPARVRTKIKTPLEHAVSSLRANRGRTDGITGVLDFLASTGHIPHYNAVPTGWPEGGDSWIGTNNSLDRQNFPFAMLSSGGPEFGADPLSLLEDNGVSTAPGNADAIVEFLTDVYFGGALTPAEKQAGVDFLNTNDLGNPEPYDQIGILKTVIFLMGYPQYQEQ